MRSTLAEARHSLRSDEEEMRRGAVARLGRAAERGRSVGGARLPHGGDGRPSWRVRKEAAARAAAFGTIQARGRGAGGGAGRAGEHRAAQRRRRGAGGPGQQAVPALIEALSRAPEHRKLLADALGLIGDLHAGDALAPLVDDQTPTCASRRGSARPRRRHRGAGGA